MGRMGFCGDLWGNMGFYGVLWEGMGPYGGVRWVGKLELTVSCRVPWGWNGMLWGDGMS